MNGKHKHESYFAVIHVIGEGSSTELIQYLPTCSNCGISDARGWDLLGEHWDMY